MPYEWLKAKYKNPSGPGIKGSDGSRDIGAMVKQKIDDGYAYLDIPDWGIDGIEDYILSLKGISELLQIEEEMQRSKKFSEEEKGIISTSITKRLQELGVF